MAELHDKFLTTVFVLRACAPNWSLQRSPMAAKSAALSIAETLAGERLSASRLVTPNLSQGPVSRNRNLCSLGKSSFARIGFSVRAVLAMSLALIAIGSSSKARAADGSHVQRINVPSGVEITPTASAGSVIQDLPLHLPSGPVLKAGQAAALALSPDGKLLAVVTNGYNIFHVGTPDRVVSGDYVFLFDVQKGVPRQLQVLPIGSSFLGLAWTPSGGRLLVSGGTADTVLEFQRDRMSIRLEKTIKLGHDMWAGECPHGLPKSDCAPQTGAISVSPDGTTALVANFQNDSVSLLDVADGRVIGELDLRPGKLNVADAGKPGGTFPRDIAWIAADRVLVTSARDREIIALSVHNGVLKVLTRFEVPGQPTVIISNLRARRTYVALESTSQVAVIDPERNKIIEIIDAAAPRSVFNNVHRLGGAIPNSLALTRDGRSLLVTNAGENAVAVISLGNAALGQQGNDPSRVIGLVPTGWYPTGVTPSKDGRLWYVSNLKSPTGPGIPKCGITDENGKLCVPDTFKPVSNTSRDSDAFKLLVSENQSVNQQEKGTLLTIPAPPSAQLIHLTEVVARNNHMTADSHTEWPPELLEFLRKHIHHIVFVVKANKSYDVVLGDLKSGNGDPRLAWFPVSATPNEHKIASQFVLLDNFRDASGVGWTGLDWSMAGRTTDLREREEPMGMAGRAWPEGSGNDRALNMGYKTNKERRREDPDAPLDADILPGARDVFELDGPDGKVGEGYIWDSILRAGKSIRNWGDFPADDLWFGMSSIPKERNPFETGIVVFQETKPSLMPFTDPYYHYQWDFAYPDFWRVKEWTREFNHFGVEGSAPNLMMIWLCQDVGEWSTETLDGIKPPYGNMADNDYAFGQVVASVAHSPFANDTLIISMEDSSRDGADHVDVHRSTLFIAGPYVRRQATVSTYYTSVDVIRTIEDVLGAEPNSINEKFARPMGDLFDKTQEVWNYEAIVPDALKSTKLPLLRNHGE